VTFARAEAAFHNYANVGTYDDSDADLTMMG
jgi:hypothetical protein